VIKIIGWTRLPGAFDARDPLAGFRDTPIAPSGAGPIATVVSEVLERTRGEIDADVFVEQWWPDRDAFGRWAAAAPGPWLGPWYLATEHVLRRPAIGAGELKLLGSAYKLDHFSTADFFAYWRDVHGPLSARAPGLRGYVVSEVVERLAGDLHVDGFVELWWPDAATLAAANASPEVAVAWADVANYAATTGSFWLVREHVIGGALPGFPAGSLEDGG